MGDVKVNSAEIQLKDHGGGVFGSVAYTPIVSESFENGVLGNSINDIVSLDTTQMVYNNTTSATGSQSSQNNILMGESGFGKWGYVYTLPKDLTKGDEFWVRVKTFWPAGSSWDVLGSGDALKFLRLHGFESDGITNRGYSDIYIRNEGNSFPFYWTHEGVIQEGGGSNRNISDAADTITRGTWEVYEYYIKLDDTPISSGGDGKVRMWKDGVLMGDLSMQTMVSPTDVYKEFLLFTFWNGNAPNDETMYVDDFEIATNVSPPTEIDGAGNRMIGVS